MNWITAFQIIVSFCGPQNYPCVRDVYVCTKRAADQVKKNDGLELISACMGDTNAFPMPKPSPSSKG